MKDHTNKISKSSHFHLFQKQLPLQLIVLSGMIYIFIFSYIPMVGIIMGFKDYDIIMGVGGIFSSKWVGLKYIKEFVNDVNFKHLVINTACISLLKMIFTFPAPIIFAIMLNEMKSMKFKKIVQTSSYLPHFISWVVVSGISFRFLSSTGVINNLLQKLGLIKEAIPFLSSPKLYWSLAVSLDVWKEMGWWTIVFLAAIVGVSHELYESAAIDGAGRLRRIWYITLPCIKPTVVTVLILALGNLFGGGLSGSNFEQSYLLGNAMNSSSSEIIQTYIFRVGLSNGRYAYATAVGLIQSLISLMLIFTSNYSAKKISGTSLF
jgi:putative aldouronate transport system permease protein